MTDAATVKPITATPETKPQAPASTMESKSPVAADTKPGNTAPPYVSMQLTKEQRAMFQAGMSIQAVRNAKAVTSPSTAPTTGEARPSPQKLQPQPKSL